MRRNATLVSALLLLAACGRAQKETREAKVARDREEFGAGKAWFYDDLPAGVAAAKSAKKPLLVTLRCVP